MIQRLRLQNFRSHQDTEFTFVSGVNALIGPNGVGKTNVVEAIYATLTGGSWRGKDELMIAHGSDWARVDLETNDHTYTLKLDGTSGQMVKTRTIDGTSRRSGYLPVVLFEPDFIRVLTDGPDLRRQWVDNLISQLKPGYSHSVHGYKRALSQRNALLKQGAVDTHHIFVWNLKLTEYGAQIAQERQELARKINQQATKEYRELSGAAEAVSVVYTPSFSGDYASGMLTALQQNLSKDVRIGFTTIGPHREDLGLVLRDKPLTDTASRGEVRTLATSLIKITEALFEKDYILLLDDILSELDKERSDSVISSVGSNQTIVSSAEDRSWSSGVNKIHIRGKN